MSRAGFVRCLFFAAQRSGQLSVRLLIGHLPVWDGNSLERLQRDTPATAKSGQTPASVPSDEHTQAFVNRKEQHGKKKKTPDGNDVSLPTPAGDCAQRRKRGERDARAMAPGEESAGMADKMFVPKTGEGFLHQTRRSAMVSKKAGKRGGARNVDFHPHQHGVSWRDNMESGNVSQVRVHPLRTAKDGSDRTQGTRRKDKAVVVKM